MQLYRGMDIGTAKLRPPRAARGAAPRARSVGGDRAGQRRRVPAGRPGGRSTTCSPAGVRRCWSAGRACTCGPSWSSSSSPAPTRSCAPAGGGAGRGRPGRAARPAGAARPRGGGAHPAEQRPADRAGAGGHRADRWPVRGDPARPDARTTRPSTSESTATRPSSTSGSRRGWTTCGQQGLRRRGARAGAARAAARAARRAGRWATSRCCDTWPASARLEEARAETVQATRRFVRRQRSPGSAATRASSGSTRRPPT